MLFFVITSTRCVVQEFILYIFARVQEAVSDPSLPDYLNGRYCALVYQIIHFFFDLRQSLASGGTVAPHASDDASPAAASTPEPAAAAVTATPEPAPDAAHAVSADEAGPDDSGGAAK